MNPTHPHTILKFCPKCGSPEFIPQNDNSFKCNACSFRFYYNAASAVAALILDGEGRLLLVRRALEPHKGTLDLPGGFVSEDESSEEALKREVMEELGGEVLDYQYIKSYPNRYEYSGITVFTNDAAFECTLKDYAALKPADDVADYIWIHPKDIVLEEIGIPSIRKMVGEYILSLGY